jgi:hypothetical protein
MNYKAMEQTFFEDLATMGLGTAQALPSLKKDELVELLSRSIRLNMHYEKRISKAVVEFRKLRSAVAGGKKSKK